MLIFGVLITWIGGIFSFEETFFIVFKTHTFYKLWSEMLHVISDSTFVSWEIFKDKTILITGATGLIGATIVRTLLYVNNQNELNLRVIAMVRSEDKAKEKLGECIDDSSLKLLMGIIEQLLMISEDIDYIIHCASQTSSRGFGETPVETSIKGTENILELSRKKDIKGILYLSTMEVYVLLLCKRI